jgi:four helix bundle protein
MSGTFRDLKCWQKAFDLSLSIYKISRSFPKDELFGLTSQLRRAAVSVVSNIAEGKGRSTEKDLLRFLANARGSLFELETQIALAENLSYISQTESASLLRDASETGKLINGLIRAFDSNRSNPSAA